MQRTALHMQRNFTENGVPSWVPEGARNYLAHTEQGTSIRQLARSAGCHASTVLRQVRKVESRRDDPLVDAVLRKLAGPMHQSPAKVADKDTETMNALPSIPDAKTLKQESRRILPALCRPSAVLAVSDVMEKAVVVDDTHVGKPLAVDRGVAQAMALKDWIACDKPGRISRYHITAEGRAELARLMAQEANRARGFAESLTRFDGAPHRPRTARSEPPLVVLSRRREKDGQPFLGPELVSAGDRLREDFELARLDPKVTRNWDDFLAGRALPLPPAKSGAIGAEAARHRLAAALRELGPGLGDVALRCCCYLEGLETCEKQLGWSQRSGKIVLRIALQRLRRHYDACGPQNDLLG
ncbi:DUF6456 domain-containing protein [Mesobacterium sp. TK19101]|uniref:DUF6456 domain-containing protein n=1 Tax=Mesobacterium hydrothermale TaxID=3111907 RepID=A0ABU6HET3_9RHOB|nr:DUF6456 domain-containing protein [Mesobacterium sp. TK19101]MEC3860970.1 DUF6456 domain-containing protein [Mesobacterium sp. TK19101]